MSLSLLFFNILLICGYGRKVIIDTDGKANDAFALTWAMQAMNYKALDIVAITTVKSEISPYDAFRNVIHILNLTLHTGPDEEAPYIQIGKSVEDFEKGGLDSMLDDGIFGWSQTFMNYPEILWTDDMIQKITKSSPLSSDLMVELIQQHPHEITVITMGPLTNLYAAESKSPGILKLIDEIYIYGGAFANRTGDSVNSPLSEANFNADPEAIHKILNVIGDAGSGPNVYIFPLDTSNVLQFQLGDMSSLYSFLGQELQSEVEMCRVKIHGDDSENSMYEYEDQGMEGEDGEFEYHCSPTGLLYLFYEKTMEQMMRSNYLDGKCDCVLLGEASIIGHLLYPQLFEFKYVHCEVNRENGMIWYDERMIPHSVRDFKLPNCLVNLKVESSKVVQMFSRDMITLLGTMNMHFWQGMMTMDGMDMDGFEDLEGMEGMEDMEGMEFDADGGYGGYGYGQGIYENEEYMDGDYADEYGGYEGEWQPDLDHEDL